MDFNLKRKSVDQADEERPENGDSVTEPAITVKSSAEASGGYALLPLTHVKDGHEFLLDEAVLPGQEGHSQPCNHRHEHNQNGSHSHEHMDNALSNKTFADDEFQEEKEHFETILNAFRYYKIHGIKKLAKQRNRYEALNDDEKMLLPSFLESMSDIRQCLSINQAFIEKILEHTPFDDTFRSDDNGQSTTVRPASTFHMDKVHTTLRMFVRDWSVEGENERTQAYLPLIRAVQQYLPADNSNPKDVQILVPGAGLGRLAWELARCGYTSIGNEFSLYMLLASNFVLNCYPSCKLVGYRANSFSVGSSGSKQSPGEMDSSAPPHSFDFRVQVTTYQVCSQHRGESALRWRFYLSQLPDQMESVREVNAYKIYPWIGHASNNLSSANQMIGVSIPDVNPAADLPAGHSFGMVAGDFLEVFERNATWDCVVACFFIDTAQNILDYIDHIWHLLKPGGYWMNLGPLLYHFADMPNQSCLELTYEQVKTAIIKRGFAMLDEKLDVKCAYVQNPFSMLRHEYRCVFFVCRKPR